MATKSRFVTFSSNVDTSSAQHVLALRDVPFQDRLKLLQETAFSPIKSHTEDDRLPLDAMLDSMFAVYHDIQHTTGDNPHFASFSKRFAPMLDYLGALRLNLNDFETIQKLASGAFGKVSLVRGRHDGKLYALKALWKTTVLKQENVFFMEERNVMAFTQSKWITSLYAAFQDNQNLYLVMEYLPGGDLISLLESKNNTSLPEHQARFYIAQLVAAVEELHRQKFAHRDLKPHNILIDIDGHIKLADFGSCIKVNAQDKVSSSISVGTPDYISPEVLSSQEGKGSMYGLECDWWAVGVVIYEILCGDPPFYAESLAATYANIQGHKGDLEFPEDIELSESVRDLINRLLSPYATRLGKNGVDEIKAHSWFQGIDWDNLRSLEPPFVPTLDSEIDTRYFPNEDDDDAELKNLRPAMQRTFMGQHLPFIGYTYVKDSPLYQISQSIADQDSAYTSPTDEQVQSTAARRSISDDQQARLQSLELSLEQERLSSKALEDAVQAERELLAAEKQTHQQTMDQVSALQQHSVSMLQKHDIQRRTLEEQLALAHDSRDIAQKELVAVRSELEKTHSLVSSTTAEQRGLLSKQKELVNELGTASQQLEALRNEVSENKARVTSLLAQAAVGELTANTLRSQVADKDRDVGRLQNEVQNQSTTIVNQKTEITALIKKTTELEFEVHSIKQQMSDEVHAREVEATSFVKEIQADLIKTRDELLSERERARVTSTQLQQESTQAQELASQIRLLNEQIARMNNQTRDEAVAREEMGQRLKEREMDVKRLQEKLASNESHVEKLEHDMKNKEEMCQTAANAVLQKDLELQESVRSNLSLKTQLEASKADLSERELHSIKAAADREEVVQELAQARTLCEIRSGEIKQMQEHISMQDEKLSKLQEQLALDAPGSSDKSSKRLKAEYRDLQQRFAELQGKLASTEKQLQENKLLLTQHQSLQRMGSPSHGQFSPGSLHSPSPNDDNASSISVRRPSFLKRKMTRKMLGGLGHGTEPTSPTLSSRGWLRVPKKEGFIRHGWKRQFFIVRDSKLWMWEKEKDSESSPGAIVVDLGKVDLFSIGSANATDVFHASSREITCMFKLQFTTAQQGSFVTSSSANTSPAASHAVKPDDATSVHGSIIESIEQKIKMHRDKIEIETKLLQGADRLVQQSKGPFRQQASQQYQQCQDRITILETEVASWQKQLEEAQHQNQHEVAPSSEDTNKATSESWPRAAVRSGMVINTKSGSSPIDIDTLLLPSDNLSPVNAAFQVAGHHFKLQQFDNNFACRVCHEQLGSCHLAVMCPMCDYTAHRHCAPATELNCQEVRALNSVLPQYFMCDTVEEKRKWIACLHTTRKYCQSASRNGTPPALSLSNNSLNSHSEISELSEISEKQT